mmetsp:Transcript_1730/g.3652  ORF Transcript_1730/g.3652 Transcript_1730/m.3652 type:complete len:91 (-) Transcript_1730:284-556(-)
MMPFPSTTLLLEDDVKLSSSFCLALFLREDPALVATASFVNERFETIWHRDDDKGMEWVNTYLGDDSPAELSGLNVVQIYAVFPYRATNR